MTCLLNDNKFAVGVADILLYDKSCNGEQLVLNGKTNINTSITQAVQTGTVYGGKGSKPLMEYGYQKEITLTIEDAAFNPVYLALQNGANIANELTDFYAQEEVQFDMAGIATLSGTPSGLVQVSNATGQYDTVVAVGNTITNLAMAGKKALVVFTEAGEFRKLTIAGDKFTKSLKAVLSIDIFNSNQEKVETMQIVIPNFKPDGNFELSLTQDGVATSNMAGKALDECGKYADIIWKDLTKGAGVCYTNLIVSSDAVELDSAEPNNSETVTVIGVRGGIYGNATISNDKLTWTSADETVATVVNGVITAGATATSGETTIVTVTDGTLTDMIVVTIN